MAFYTNVRESRVRKKQYYFALVFSVVILASFAQAQFEITHAQLCDKARGMWLGQIVANMAGRSTEGHYQTTPNPAESMPWVLRSGSEVWDADDDTDIEYINIHILEEYGFAPTPAQIANEWLEHSTSWGIYIANRQAWYLMGDGILPPETGSRAFNFHWYAIDSQITNETTASICPALPQVAVDLTEDFSEITNAGFSVHAAQFYSAMYAWAYVESDIGILIQNALRYIPTQSRSYQVVSDVVDWYEQDMLDGTPDWRATRDKLKDYYYGSYAYGRNYYWIESTVNLGATVLCLLYGDGDYKETVQIGILAGWDCDCNPATAGGILGIINGCSGLPSDLFDASVASDRYKNTYRQGLPDPALGRPQYDTITSIATRIADLAAQNILDNGGILNGEIYSLNLPQLPAQLQVPQADGPIGLVGDAIDAEILVSTSAAVEYHDANNDMRNLDAIIDGVVSNEINGHKPYYSYSSNPPEQDWYQVEFGQKVLFSSVVFHEGNIQWGGINTYSKDDTPRGGCFTDLRVEILKNGEYFEPANQIFSQELLEDKMYQDIEITFAHGVGEAIRIIGSPGGSQQYTTIMELEIEGDLDTGLYLESVTVNDNQEQRSKVETIAILLNRSVAVSQSDVEIWSLSQERFLEASEFSVQSGANVGEFIVSFAGNRIADGDYELRLDCGSINDGADFLLDDDGIAMDMKYTIEFHQIYGDVDGSGGLELSDFSAFTSFWHSSTPAQWIDFNGDGVVNSVDLHQFAMNWCLD